MKTDTKKFGISLIFLLFIISIAGVIMALILPEWANSLLLSGPIALASLLLLLRAWVRRSGRKREAAQKWIILDGSNVMHWKEGTPQIETVREVVSHLSSLGLSSGVVFDANAGYLTTGSYLHDSGFGKALGLPEERVMVVPKGAPADPAILKAARDLKAQIVTNDRFRDWADDYPEANDPGLLIRGGYRSGRLWLSLGDDTG